MQSLHPTSPAILAPPSPANAARKALLDCAAHYSCEAAEALSETLWPTRCAVCDTPGEVLCARCRLQLPYLDWWRACPRCGAPFGRVQCSECTPVLLQTLGREDPPYNGCVSAVVYDDAIARIVRTWKDAGERRLATTMAEYMALSLPPLWLAAKPLVVAIPATTAAQRRRGFDHGTNLAHAIAARLNLETAPLLARPRSRDQRALARRGRIANMEGRFTVLPGASPPPFILLTDDVYTTGATLFAATDALRNAGALDVRCVTFARVV